MTGFGNIRLAIAASFIVPLITTLIGGIYLYVLERVKGTDMGFGLHDKDWVDPDPEEPICEECGSFEPCPCDCGYGFCFFKTEFVSGDGSPACVKEDEE